MKNTKIMKRIIALLLMTVMLVCSNSIIYATNVVDSVTDSNDTTETEEQESVQVEEVPVGYIFEVPTEEGKDVYIQLGTSEDVLADVIMTIERAGETMECNVDEMIENVVAFHMEAEDKLISISGTVNGNEFESSLVELDESEGEKIVVEEVSEDITEEDLENIEIESYVVDNAQEDENAIAEVMEETNPISTFSLSEREVKSEYIVVIDPGHSIKSAGAQRDWDGVTYYEHELVMKIARYLVAELEQYAGVKVYLTRDENSHRELVDRVKYARDLNADMLVSIHLNATSETVTTANGVTAMVAKIGTYNTENAKEGQAIARSIMDELVALGFKDRDFTIRMSENGTTYPDGSLADYYQIIKGGQEYGVPSMIIEHGFLNNESDFRKYLSTEAGLQSLGIADATGIANYLGLSKEDNSRLSGWQTIDGKTYYYENGKPVTGTPIIDGKKYWFDGNGVRRTGWLYLLNWKMYFDSETGEAKVGMADIDGKRYLFNSDGVMQNYAGTTIINGKKYWFSTDDASLKTGWLNLAGMKLYFMPETYEGVTGLKLIDGEYYLFNMDGVLLSESGTPIVDGKKYWIKPDGSLGSGWLYLGNWKMYFDPETLEAKVGMADISGKRYLFNSDGVMQNFAGTTIVNGKKYWFSTDDASLKTGWLTLGNWKMYFDPETYEAAIGWVTIDGKKYYFDENGVLKEGFITKGEYTYYLKSDGTYATGTPVIDGEKYGFDSQGRQIFGWYTLGSWKFYFDPDNGGAAVTTYKKLDDITYYFNNDGTLASSSNNYYNKLKDPANGKTYTLESQFDTDPQVDDETLLAALTYTESGNQELACQVATALVVLNRVESKSYPDTLKYVVYQKSQFEVAHSGALTKILNAYKNNDQTQLKWLKTTEEAVAIAMEIMGAHKTDGLDRVIDDVTLPNGKTDFDYLGFMTPAAFERMNLDPVATEAFQIDDVIFYTKWITKS